MNLYEARKELTKLESKRNSLVTAHNQLCKDNMILGDKNISEHIDMLYHTTFTVNEDISKLESKIRKAEFNINLD